MQGGIDTRLGLALTVAALALPGAALAAKPVDPGADGNAKKDVTELPAPVQQQQEPAPQAEPKVTEPQKSEPIKPVKVEGQKPLTQGTVKKLPTTTTTAPTSTTQAGTTTRRRSTSRGTATRRSTTRSNRGGATRGRERAAAVRRLNAEQRAERRKKLEAAAAKRREAREAKEAARKKRAKAAAATPPGEDDEKSGGLVRFSRAAENVVEVIPGAVLLAMTGLAGLVMLLVFRSWFMERRRARALTESYGVTVQALATAIEAKDHTTGGHIERVRDLGLLLARELDVREVSDPQMAYGFLLHDVGKLSVPDAILRHPGRLDPDAWSVMRRHPDEGVRILGSIPFLDRALDVVRHHHERWDGTGYPAGLAGEEIPLWARIFSVVDALDAMTADRPYRPAMSYPDALEEIRRHSGTQFDPSVVEALERIDAAEVEQLLEPAQMKDGVVAGTLEPLEAILEAAGRGRPQPAAADGNGAAAPSGDAMAANGNGVPLAELDEPGEDVPQRPVAAA